MVSEFHTEQSLINFITQELREAVGSICSSKQNINKAEYVNELNFPYHESGVYN